MLDLMSQSGRLKRLAITIDSIKTQYREILTKLIFFIFNIRPHLSKWASQAFSLRCDNRLH